MNCRRCGMALQETDKFCSGCGAPVTEQPVEVPAAEQSVETPVTEQPVEAPAAQQPVEVPAAEQPAGAWQQPPYAQQPVSAWDAPAPKKKGVSKILIGVIAGVAVIAVVLALIFSRVFASPASQVLKAVSKSAGAFSAASDNLELADMTGLMESGEYSQNVALWIDYMEDYEEVSGLGIRMTADSSLPDREMAMVLTPFLGSADLLDIQMKIEDSQLYLGSPELTGDKFYMIDTETLGTDLTAMGADTAGMENFGFNIFDISETLMEAVEPDEKAQKAFTKAVGNLADAIEVEKDGSETVEVNGKDLKCKAYNVVIPQDEMEDVLDAMEDLAGYDRYIEVYMEMFESMGLPAEIMESLESNSLLLTGSGDSFGSLRDMLTYLGDIELKVYINDGYVVSVVYVIEIDSGEAELVLNLGGGKNYVDDLSLCIVNFDGDMLAVFSSGKHSGEKGVFTDETVLEMTMDGYTETLMVSELRYEPEDDGYFSWELIFEEDESFMLLEGQLTAEKNSMNLRIDELGLYEYGEAIMAIGMEYGIGTYNDDSVEVEDFVALADMTEDDLMEAVNEISENGTVWAADILEQIPELANLF